MDDLLEADAWARKTAEALLQSGEPDNSRVAEQPQKTVP